MIKYITLRSSIEHLSNKEREDYYDKKPHNRSQIFENSVSNSQVGNYTRRTKVSTKQENDVEISYKNNTLRKYQDRLVHTTSARNYNNPLKVNYVSKLGL